MPSLFSRARTTSTPTKKSAALDHGLHDEFGRVTSRGSARQVAQQHLTASAKKAGKKGAAATPKKGGAAGKVAKVCRCV